MPKQEWEAQIDGLINAQQRKCHRSMRKLVMGSRNVLSCKTVSLLKDQNI